MTVRINKQKINLREKLTEFEDKVNFDEVVRGLGEYTGNVGIGTTNPNSFTGFMGENAISTTINSNHGGVLNLQRGTNINNSGIGALQFINTNNSSATGTGSDSQLLGLISIQNVTSDSNIDSDAGGNLRIYTKEEAGSCEERMRITSAGNVGIGTTNPVGIISASSATNGFAYIKTGSIAYGVFTSSSTGPALYINKTDATTSAATDYINFRNKGVKVGGIEYDGADVQLVQTSDSRLKKNIQDSESGLNLVNNLKVRSFDWVGEKRQSKKFGFVAQEMHEVFEEAVKIGGEDENESPWGVFDLKLIPVLAKAIQEQQSIIEDLKSRIETLESK